MNTTKTSDEQWVSHQIPTSKQATHPIKLEFREYKLADEFPVLVLSPSKTSAAYHNTEQKYHFHNCIEIGFCHKNEHLLTFDNRVYKLKPGDFFVLSPYSMHYVNHTVTECTGCCEYLYVKPAELLRDFYPLDLPESMYWFKNSDCPFIFSKKTHSRIYGILMLLLQEYRTQKEGYQYVIKGLFQSLMAELTQELSCQATPFSDKYRNISMLLPALKTIHSDFAQPLKTSALARKCHLSASGFSALFLEQLGEPPGKYLNRIRLQKACELLYSTELSILNIAIEAGFSSLSNFYRCFHDCYHISPKKWRNLYRSVQKKDVSRSLFTLEHR